jgi:hypothetical protein
MDVDREKVQYAPHHTLLQWDNPAAAPIDQRIHNLYVTLAHIYFRETFVYIFKTNNSGSIKLTHDDRFLRVSMPSHLNCPPNLNQDTR